MVSCRFHHIIFPSFILLWTTDSRLLIALYVWSCTIRYAGTATEVVPCYDRQCLVYLSFDDQVDAVFEFPAPDIQRILPSQSGKPSNKVFAVDGAGALQLAYECSPIRIDVGDVVCYKYPSSDKAEGQWHRGRVAISHENGTCDVVFDAGVVS
jgi:hypothetical protein